MGSKKNQNKNKNKKIADSSVVDSPVISLGDKNEEQKA
jgi:hypothetical protein